MLARIKGSPDPGDGFKERIGKAALDAWNAVSSVSAQLSQEELTNALLVADAEIRDAFFESLCDELYDVEAVLQETDMSSLLDDQDPMAAIAAHTKEFYAGLLRPGNECDGISAQRKTCLAAVAVKEVAAACARVALGNGLPRDGHVVHSMFQGQAAFLHSGKQGCVKVQAIAQSESSWNVAASKLALVCMGESASGKGNAKSILLGWLEGIGESTAPASCTNVLKQGNLSVHGVLTALQEGSLQVQIVNEELEKVINRKKDKYFQESDLIEFLDGSDAFGKAVSGTILCCKPDGWMFLGSQRKAYLDNLAGGQGSNGRLRLVIIALDAAQVFETAFEDKFVPRKASDSVLGGTLAQIAMAQQRVTPANPLPETEASQALTLPPLLPPRADTAVPVATEEQPSRRGALRCRPRKRLTDALPESTGADLPDPLVVGAPEVSAVQWSPTAAVILAGYMNGAAEACGEVKSGPGVSIVTKHAGKSFGACAVANLGIRNGLLRLALPRAPLDNSVRTLDALASVPKTQIYSINQMSVEREGEALAADTQSRPRSSRGESACSMSGSLDASGSNVDDREKEVKLEPEAYAIRRLFESLATSSEQARWEDATTTGIPLKMNVTDKDWLNYRATYFTRKRKRDVDSLRRYGGIENLNEHGKAGKWQALLKLCAEKRLGSFNEGESNFIIKWSVDAGLYLKDKIHVSNETYEKLVAPQQ